jgi:hypothetical protein
MASSKGGSQRGKQGRAAERGKKMRAQSSKKEKLLGQELGKTGRAAERGKPVTNAQKGLGNYSRQTMQNKKMRDMPVKQKLSSALDASVAGMAASPIGIRAPKFVTKAINTKANQIGQGLGDRAFDRSLDKIESMTPNPGGKIKGMRGTVVTPGGVSEGRSSYRVTPVRTEAQMLGDVQRRIKMAEKDAARIARYSAQGARRGIVAGAAGGGVVAGTAGLVAGYAAGKRDSSKKSNTGKSRTNRR